MYGDYKRSLEHIAELEEFGYKMQWESEPAAFRDGGSAPCEICSEEVCSLFGSFRVSRTKEVQAAWPWVICDECMGREQDQY